MPDGATEHHLYRDLAPWWPLISPLDDYAEEAAFTLGVLRSATTPAREVLDLGSGGGHMAAHLRAHLDVTLVDRSEDMLAVSRQLNPGLEHLVGDMRTVRLGRTFDAVLVHDAIDYMTTEGDLRLAIDTAFAHCRPGGAAVLIPDNTAETFVPGTGVDGSEGADGRAVRYLTWEWDPDPTDTWVQTDYAFLLRHADGSVRSVHDAHRTGSFPRSTWLDLLAEAGFVAEITTEVTTEDRPPRDVFVGRRPV